MKQFCAFACLARSQELRTHKSGAVSGSCSRGVGPANAATIDPPTEISVRFQNIIAGVVLYCIPCTDAVVNFDYCLCYNMDVYGMLSIGVAVKSSHDVRSANVVLYSRQS